MDDKWNAQSLPAEARELALRSLAVAATKTKPMVGMLQDFDLNQYIQEEDWEMEPNSIPGMGPKKHSSINIAEKDLLTSSSPRPAKRRRFYENLTSPQRSNATPAFIQSLMASPDRHGDQRMYRRGRGGRNTFRSRSSRWSATQRRGVNRPLPQPGRFDRQRDRGRSSPGEPRQPHSVSTRGFIPSAQPNTHMGGAAHSILAPHQVENFRGRGGYNQRRGPLPPLGMGPRGYGSSRGMHPRGPLAQGGRHTLPQRGVHRRGFRGRGMMRGGRGRGISRGQQARGSRGGGSWGSTTPEAQRQQTRGSRGGWGAPSNVPPNSNSGWRPGFSGRGRGH